MTPPQRPSTRGAVLAWFVVIASLIGCKDSRPSAPPRREGVTAPKPVSATASDARVPAPPAPNIAAQLFIDTSGSMSGFFGASRSQKDAGNILMAVHEEIDGAISESGLSSAKKCTVGDNVKCDGVPTAPAKLASAALYHETTSRLDRLLARAPAPARIDPNQPPPPDALDNARITLLITDGMEVASDTAGATSCANGADPTCVRELLERRIAEGFGIWLVGVLLPFNGVHFPERNLTGSYFDRARTHVDQLKFDPRNLGVTFAIAGKLGTDASTGKSTYVYRGYRPLLVFVFSRDAALARGFVGALVNKLRKAPIQPGKMRPEDTVQTVELAPLPPITTHAVRVEIVPQPEQQQLFGSGFDPARLAEFKLQESARFGDGLAQKVWCGANGRSMLFVRYDQSGEHLLPSYFKEQVVLVSDAKPPPPGAIAQPTTVSNDRIRTGVDCGPISPSPNVEIGFALRTQLALDQPGLEHQWWSHNGWSSEDAWQMPERVYRLEDIVLPILKARVTRLAAWDRVVLHIRRD